MQISAFQKTETPPLWVVFTPKRGGKCCLHPLIRGVNGTSLTKTDWIKEKLMQQEQKVAYLFPTGGGEDRAGTKRLVFVP